MSGDISAEFVLFIFSQKRGKAMQDELVPILLFKNSCGRYEPHKGYSLLSRQKTLEIINDLKYYIKNYSDFELEYINSHALDFLDDAIKHKESKIKKKSGYVYVLQCKRNYKIGYSKNVTQRLSQLNNRPFKCKLILKVFSDDAYHIEQELHRRLSKYRIHGEWYSGALKIKSLIQQVAKDMSIEIQFQEV